jgi:uncharacterized protein (DUF4415 family)
MKSIRTKKKGSKPGSVDLLPADAFNPKETKFRVTMFMSLDVLDEVRKRAKEIGLPYQTYLNQLIRESIFPKSESKLETRVASLEATLKEIKQKLAS